MKWRMLGEIEFVLCGVECTTRMCFSDIGLGGWFVGLVLGDGVWIEG